MYESTIIGLIQSWQPMSAKFSQLHGVDIGALLRELELKGANPCSCVTEPWGGKSPTYSTDTGPPAMGWKLETNCSRVNQSKP